MKEALADEVQPGQITIFDAYGMPEGERSNFFTC